MSKFLTSTINLDKNQKFTITDEGFIITKAYLTRTGVFDYGSNKQLRTPEEVFKPESLDTLKMKPLTFNHPSNMVSPENIHFYTVGSISSDVVQDGDFISATLVVTAKPAVDYVLDKFDKGEGVELSCGYWVEHDEQAGQHDGENYDIIQKNIRYNHVSIVEKGRAGENVRMLLDSANNENKHGDDNMTITKEQLDAVNIQLDAAKKEADEAKANLDASKAQLDAANEQLATLKTQIDAVNAEKVELTEKLERLAILDSVKAFDNAVKDQSVKELKIECIKKNSESFDATDKSDEYINARFDAAVEFNGELKKATNNGKILALKQADTDDKKEEVKDARSEMLKKQEEGKYDA